MASRPFRDLAHDMSAHLPGEQNRPVMDTGRVLEFVCIRCSTSYPADVTIDSKGCARCQDTAPANLAPVYAAPQPDPLAGATSSRSLWRFANMLPCTEA